MQFIRRSKKEDMKAKRIRRSMKGTRKGYANSEVLVERNIHFSSTNISMKRSRGRPDKKAKNKEEMETKLGGNRREKGVVRMRLEISSIHRFLR